MTFSTVEKVLIAVFGSEAPDTTGEKS